MPLGITKYVKLGGHWISHSRSFYLPRNAISEYVFHSYMKSMDQSHSKINRMIAQFIYFLNATLLIIIEIVFSSNLQTKDTTFSFT